MRNRAYFEREWRYFHRSQSLSEKYLEGHIWCNIVTQKQLGHPFNHLKSGSRASLSVSMWVDLEIPGNLVFRVHPIMESGRETWLLGLDQTCALVLDPHFIATGNEAQCLAAFFSRLPSPCWTAMLQLLSCPSWQHRKHHVRKKKLELSSLTTRRRQQSYLASPSGKTKVHNPAISCVFLWSKPARPALECVFSL